MKHWWVTTPELYHSNGWEEPPEYYVDFVSVEAPTKRKALVEAVRKLRAKNSEWTSESTENPFKGLKAEIADCKHGYCWCDICAEKNDYEECKECLKEWEAEYKIEEENYGSLSSG